MTPSLMELRCFDAAVRCGSLSAAARELGVTQQAVSSRIRTFERSVGVALLHRSPAGVSPTVEGDALLTWGREVLGAADRLDEGVASLRGGTASTLVIGASQTLAAHLLPGWLLALRERQTARGSAPTEISLRAANSEEVTAQVRSGEIDLGFVESPMVPGGLGSVEVMRDRMIVAVSPDHPWAGRRRVTLEELARAGLVTREQGSGTRAALENALAARAIPVSHEPAVVLTTEAAVRSAVARGVAPAVVSELTVHDDVRLRRIRAIPIGPTPLTRPFTAIWRGTPRDLAGARRELVDVARHGIAS